MKKKYKTGLYVHYDPETFEKEKHFSPKRQLRTLHTTLDRHPELIKVVLYACKHMWGCVAISIVKSFSGFIVSFVIVAVGTVLEGIGAKLGDIIAS